MINALLNANLDYSTYYPRQILVISSIDIYCSIQQPPTQSSYHMPSDYQHAHCSPAHYIETVHPNLGFKLVLSSFYTTGQSYHDVKTLNNTAPIFFPILFPIPTPTSSMLQSPFVHSCTCPHVFHTHTRTHTPYTYTHTKYRTYMYRHTYICIYAFICLYIKHFQSVHSELLHVPQ